MKTSKQARLREQLTKSAAEQQDLLSQIAQLASDPEAADQIIDLQNSLNRLSAKQARLVAEIQVTQLEAPGRYYHTRAAGGRRPLREQVLDILQEIGVPAAPRAVTDYALAVHNRALPTARFASLRRDEERAYRRDPVARPAWIAPAINVNGLGAIPRIVTSSAWEIERRVIGGRSPRVNHLRTLVALVDRYEQLHRLNGDQSGEPRLLMPILRYADSVPGALEIGQEPDLARVRDAAEAELERIAGPDREERRAAAKELGKLSERFQIWGCPTPIDGQLKERAR